MGLRMRLGGSFAAIALIIYGAVSGLAAGLTAKGSLPEVMATAKKWQSDANLVHLSSLKINPDGTATEWKYSFYAPKSQKRAVVTAGSGKVTLKEVRLGNDTEPLENFIDSDKAMEIAKKNGLKGNQPSMSVGRLAGSAKANSTYWIVTGGFGKDDTSISLEAGSGKFIKKSVMGID